MLVIVSWLSYFLHPIKSATPRLIVAMSSLSLAIIGISTFNLQAPRVSYTKAVDIFTGITLTFIFASIIEFVVVNYLNQYGFNCSKSKKYVVSAGENENTEHEIPLNSENDGKLEVERAENKHVHHWGKLGARIDMIFRIAIPIFYLFFIIVYVIAFVC